MRVVLDCNVLVSAAISPTTCRQLLDQVAREHTVIYSQETLQEFMAVSRYTHLRPYFSRAKLILELILAVGVEVEPHTDSIELPDPDDVVYLQTALAGKADIIVTGNRKDFPFAEYRGVRILSPREFLDLLGGVEEAA